MILAVEQKVAGVWIHRRYVTSDKESDPQDAWTDLGKCEIVISCLPGAGVVMNRYTTPPSARNICKQKAETSRERRESWWGCSVLETIKEEGNVWICKLNGDSIQADTVAAELWLCSLHTCIIICKIEDHVRTDYDNLLHIVEAGEFWGHSWDDVLNLTKM